jgi:hypothetical protein
MRSTAPFFSMRLNLVERHTFIEYPTLDGLVIYVIAATDIAGKGCFRLILATVNVDHFWLATVAAHDAGGRHLLLTQPRIRIQRFSITGG